MCESKRDSTNDVEITPEMIEAGTAILYACPGLSPCGVDFDAAELVVKVYRAMSLHSA